MMDWYLKVMANYAGFHGRARRKEYWMFALFNAIMTFFIALCASFLMGAETGRTIANLYILAIILPGIAVGVRRMHDTNHSGWFLIIPFYGFYLLCIDTVKGDNVYGADPKYTEAEIKPASEATPEVTAEEATSV